MTISGRKLKAYERKIRLLMDQLKAHESDGEEYQLICEEISSLVGETGGELQWVVDVCEEIIH